jgi:hypothetical protein
VKTENDREKADLSSGSEPLARFNKRFKRLIDLVNEPFESEPQQQPINQRPHVKQGRRTIDNQRSARISASYRDQPTARRRAQVMRAGAQSGMEAMRSDQARSTSRRR